MPGSCDIRFRGDGRESTVDYRFEARRPGSADRKGFSSADVMVVINKNAEAKEVAVDRFAESLYGANIGVDVLTGQVLGLDPAVTVPGRGFLILGLP